MNGIETLISLVKQTTLDTLAAECKSQAKDWCRQYNGLHTAAPALVRFGKPNNKTKTVMATIWCDEHLIQAETVPWDWTTANIGGEIPLYVTDLLKRTSAEFLGLGFKNVEHLIPAWDGHADTVVYKDDEIIGVMQNCYDAEIQQDWRLEALWRVENTPEVEQYAALCRRRIYDRWTLCTD